MTARQLAAPIVMVAVGAGLFFGGRHFARKFSSPEATFMPATFVTARGIASYLFTVISWAGALLAAIGVIFFFE
ncbi:MAG: hypothetical protein ABII00_06135 [Elusimicrobiota bacterium]